VSGIAIVGSLVFLMGALVLAWHGVDHLPRATLFRYALIWGVIIVGLVLLLGAAGV